LRNWRPKRAQADLVRVFLRDFLYQNGYHDCDDAIEDTVRALGPGLRPGTPLVTDAEPSA
jgi:hypothetical protein